MRIRNLFALAAATFLMGSGLAHADTTVDHACPERMVQHEAADYGQSDEREPSSASSQDESGFQPVETRQVYHTRGWQ
jgi:hypothetical protein